MTDDDLLRGASEIGAFFRRTSRSAYHLLEAGRIPGAFRIGGIWYARRSTLTKMIEALERGEQPEPLAAPSPEPAPVKRKRGRPARREVAA